MRCVMYFEIDDNSNVVGVIDGDIRGLVSPDLYSKFVEASQDDINLYNNTDIKYRKMLIWSGKLEHKKEVALDKLKQIRKIKEELACISFQGRNVKADDKAVTMLQAYIQSNLETVRWKCVNGWLELDKEGMSLLLGEILDKKVSLYEQEYDDQA